VVDFVLHPPGKEDRALIDAVIERGVAVFDLILVDNMAAAMHKLHTKPKPQAPEVAS
jgi:PTH1 family peptidyl-tRNA hydrolase